MIYLGNQDRKQVLLRVQHISAAELEGADDTDSMHSIDALGSCSTSDLTADGYGAERVFSASSSIEKQPPPSLKRQSSLRGGQRISSQRPSANSSSTSNSATRASYGLSVEQLRASSRFKAQLGATPVNLDRCGIPSDRLFVFFDQTHSTGTNITMSADAVACITLSKDVTYRDWAQGMYACILYRESYYFMICFVS